MKAKKKKQMIKGTVVLAATSATAAFAATLTANIESAAGLFAQVSVTILGFSLTSMSILAAVVNRRLIKNMMTSGHYDLLLAELFCLNVSCFICLAFSLIVFFVPGDFERMAYTMAAGLMAAQMAIAASVGWKFHAVMVTLKTS